MLRSATPKDAILNSCTLKWFGFAQSPDHANLSWIVQSSLRVVNGGSLWGRRYELLQKSDS